MIYFLALIIPTVLALLIMMVAPKKVTFKEVLVQLVAQTILVCLVIFLSMRSHTQDTEVWNGEVVSKRHYSEVKTTAYPCGCKPKGGCSICTRSWTEWNWILKTNLGETRCIRCGSLSPWPEPALYSQIQIGDATATPHAYENPIKAAPQSLFRNSGAQKTSWQVPDYPLGFYNIIKLDRVISVNGAEVNPEWQDKLAVLNKKVGPARQANIIVVLVKDYPEDYTYALRERWLGAKKNDIVLVIGVDSVNKINWTSVIAWTKNHLIDVTLRDDIQALGVIDFDKILEKTEAHVQAEYVRQPMEDFQYLLAQVTPTTGQWIFFMIVSVLVSCSLSYFFYTNDVFDEERSARSLGYFR